VWISGPDTAELQLPPVFKPQISKCTPP
jgi:hypothetical protein